MSYSCNITYICLEEANSDVAIWIYLDVNKRLRLVINIFFFFKIRLETKLLRETNLLNKKINIEKSSKYLKRI